MQILSFSPFGYEGAIVMVEVDLRRGIPAVDVVGLADGAVKESRERMRAAIQNSGFDFPHERVLINLSPADLRKAGAGFDLAIALAVLQAQASGGAACERAPVAGSAQTVAGGTSYGHSSSGEALLVMGELELSGNIRPVRGVHAAAASAAACGVMRCIVPAVNADEAREVSGIRVYGAQTLSEAFQALSLPALFTAQGDTERTAFVPDGCIDIDGVLFPPPAPHSSFAEITGQQQLVRGLQIAAAGGHNVLVVGSPGCGKTMALERFPALLPLLTIEEAQPVTRIYSLAGLLLPHEPLMRIAPFRMPHQTASIEGMCGGGAHCVPGEISLAHNGVLFLDEASEFKQAVLQMLRVPLESGYVTLARAGRSTVYPATFQLLLAANPCPCGNFGSRTKLCLCSARGRELYWKKFSAPLLDRIDIRISVGTEAGTGAATAPGAQSSCPDTAALRKDIARAVRIQRTRQLVKNARLTPAQVTAFCPIDDGASRALSAATHRYDFSPRACAACIKIARTIADMSGAEIITEVHMTEAIQFRKNCDLIPTEC
ncbi:MAG: ATP-binding protein [Treponema sp.]|nr:ATP-binding protein [Treponema sp.]